MIKILANDGIHPDGLLLLEEAGYEVDTTKIPQDELIDRIGEYDAMCVRSATKVTKEVMDAATKMKIIGRGGVGLDNIDLQYAETKNIEVFNTPRASSRSVAELAFAHLFAIARNINRSNREMAEGDFKKLKKEYSKAGIQLRGRTMGVIGFGRIGQEAGRIALGLGMNLLASDLYLEEAEIGIDIPGHSDISLGVKVRTVSLDKLLRESDVITIHVPGGSGALIGAAEIEKMKDGAILINAARGGVVDEAALLAALDSGKIAGAGVDVFLNEPNPREEFLIHPKVSVTPHTGASTQEAQSYIGMELAERFIAYFGV